MSEEKVEVLVKQPSSKLSEKKVKFPDLEPSDEDILMSVVTENMQSLLTKAIGRVEPSNSDELQDLSLMSAMSEKDVPVKKQNDTPTIKECEEIELCRGSFRDTSVAKPPSEAHPKSYTFQLKDGNKSSESVFITFGLMALQSDFEILSTGPHQTLIRRKIERNALRRLISICCLSNKSTQVYHLVQEPQNKNSLNIVMVEGNWEQFDKFIGNLKMRLWKTSDISLSDDQTLALFLEQHKKTTIKELKHELKEQQNRRRSSFVLEVCLERVIETTQSLVQGYGSRAGGSTQTQNITIAVEVFKQSQIFEIFSTIFQSNQEALQQKRKKILKTYKEPEKLFEFIKTQQKLRLLPSDQLPYSSAIDILTTLQNHILPSQKLNCIQQYVTEIETAYTKHHKEALVNNDMDYLFPLYVWTVLHANIVNFYAHIKLTEYFVRRNDKLNNTMPLLTNLYLAAEFIRNSQPSK